MEQTNIKQDIIELCDNYIEFWKRLKEEIELIPQNDNTQLISKWKNYFVNHKETARKFGIVKTRAEIIETNLIDRIIK